MVTATSDLGYLSTSVIESLVSASMAYRQQQVTRVKDQVGELNILKGILTDLTTKLDSVYTIAKQLAGLDGTYTFGSEYSVQLGTPDVLSATASSTAHAGDYSVEVAALAKSHIIRGRQCGRIDEALGLSGTFYLGGKAASEAQALVTNDSVSGCGTAAVAEGLTQLGSGDYHVEFRQKDGAWQFRLVDAEGVAVVIKRADGTQGSTTGWQSFSDVAGTTFDTGRGLTLTFGAEPTSAGYIGDPGTARISYTAQGAAITVRDTDSLADIRAAINAATYPPGCGVVASIVDNHLVLTGAQTGAARAIVGEDATGDVLAQLELLRADGTAFHELQAACDARIIINGAIEVTRSRNSSLTNVVSGLTLNLVAVGTSTVKVSTDLGAAQNKVNELVAKFNDAMTYLRAKTAVTESSTGTYGANPTYTRAALAGDSTLASLKSRLYQVLMTRFSGGTLADLGIELNGTSMCLEVKDAAKLKEALSTDLQGTSALLAEFAKALHGALDPYVGNKTEGVLAKRSSSVDGEIKSYNQRVAEMNASIERESQQLREQYYRLQAQYLASLQRQQEWATFSSYGGYYG